MLLIGRKNRVYVEVVPDVKSSVTMIGRPSIVPGVGVNVTVEVP